MVPRGAALRDVLLADAHGRAAAPNRAVAGSTARGIANRPRRPSFRTRSRRPTRSPRPSAGATHAKLVDELGDLLFQTFFLALLCEEDGTGDLAEVAAGITEKLIRRHPHVFGEREAETAGAVRRNWEQIKRDDEGRAGVFHDVPGVLPALLHARKVQRRASAVGFDWDAWGGAWPGLESELAELRAALDAAPPPRAEHEPDADVVPSRAISSSPP